MSLFDDLIYNYKKSNAVWKIILINLSVFVVVAIVNVGIMLSGSSAAGFDSVLRWFELPANLIKFLTQPWSIVTHIFIHNSFDIFHILFNMLWLYWIGNILQEYLGNKKFYEAFFGGGIFGGVFYMLCYNIFPVFSAHVSNSYAIGASAGVLSVVIATAALLPNYPIQLLLFGTVRLKWIAIISVLIDLVSIPNGNAGGHLAHIGGALFGFLYIKYIYGKIALPNSFTRLFTKKSKLKVHYSSASEHPEVKDQPSQEDIDVILDKISKSGYDSLTKREKEILFKASKD